MGRRAPITSMASGMVSNPYAPAKEYVAQTTLCELCNITMKTRDWAAHKNSKKHRAAEKKEDEKNNPPSNGFGDNTDGFNTDANGGFSTNYSGNTNGGSDGRARFGCGETGHTKRDCPQGGSGGQACYGCGEEGHQKRDCPQGAGGQACFNCGNVG
jgi:cellular nucleic acid-binding protein